MFCSTALLFYFTLTLLGVCALLVIGALQISNYDDDDDDDDDVESMDTFSRISLRTDEDRGEIFRAVTRGRSVGRTAMFSATALETLAFHRTNPWRHSEYIQPRRQQSSEKRREKKPTVVIFHFDPVMTVGECAEQVAFVHIARHVTPFQPISRTISDDDDKTNMNCAFPAMSILIPTWFTRCRRLKITLSALIVPPGLIFSASRNVTWTSRQ